MKKEHVAAYAAGIFDGEGYVDIYKASTSKASKSPSLMLRVVISQKDGRLMNWLQDNFGGYVAMSRKDKFYIYRWDIRSQVAKQFLLTIQPFVLVKKEQVDLAIEYENKKEKYLVTLKGSKGFRQLSDDEISIRMEMKETLKKLKKVYAPYIKNVCTNND
jgi:hypothetical protein